MRSVPFILGFGVTTLLVIAANAVSYFYEQRAYHRFLEESGWVWAGHWSWGFPFSMVVAGLGFDNHSELAPLGLVLNLLVWMIVGGFAGICCELFAERFRNRKE